MNYVYRRTEPQCYTVGFYDPTGRWEPESDHDSPDAAARRVAWLNGSSSGWIYLYLSQSYSCVECREPDKHEVEAVQRGDLRVLRTDGHDVFGLRKDGTWKRISPGNPLRQVIKHGAPLVEEEQE